MSDIASEANRFSYLMKDSSFIERINYLSYFENTRLYASA